MSTTRTLPEIDLDYLYSRCTECEGCLLWNMQMSCGPKTNINRKQYKVRHLVWFNTRGKAVRKGYIPLPTVCGNERCIHPDHLTMERMNSHQRGKPMTLLRRANIAAAKRAGQGKIDMPTAKAIRASEESLQVLADRHGICPANVHRIKTSAAWLDYSNPYVQLLGTTA